MKHEPVKSSHILSTAYDADARSMQVTFKGNRTYQYDDVDPDMHKMLREAKSPGNHFHQHILGTRPHKIIDTAE